jgi:hypothetical protein
MSILTFVPLVPEVPAWMDEGLFNRKTLTWPHDVSDPHVDQEVRGQNPVTPHGTVWPEITEIDAKRNYTGL